jgi:hypothetical protein
MEGKAMGKTRKTDDVLGNPNAAVITREMLGKFVAWSADGTEIVAVADTREECESVVEAKGLSTHEVAIGRIPTYRRPLART